MEENTEDSETNDADDSNDIKSNNKVVVDEEKDEYGITYTWNNQGYECQIYYTNRNIAFIGIEADLKIK